MPQIIPTAFLLVLNLLYSMSEHSPVRGTRRAAERSAFDQPKTSNLRAMTGMMNMMGMMNYSGRCNFLSRCPGAATCRNGVCCCQPPNEMVDGICTDRSGDPSGDPSRPCIPSPCTQHEVCHDGMCFCAPPNQMINGVCMPRDRCNPNPCGENEICSPQDGSCNSCPADQEFCAVLNTCVELGQCCPAGETFQSCCGAVPRCQGTCPGIVDSAECCAYNGGTIQDGICCAAIQQSVSVCFLLDESPSIGSTDFALGKSFTDNVIGGVAADMSLVASEISIVSFASSARLRFDQGSSGPFGTAADAQAFIPSITQGGGGTCTRCGIDLCASTLNTGAQYGKVMIVLTDGYGGSVSDSRDAAKAQGITISAVGVGSGIDLTSLQDTATDNQLVFQVDDFNALANVVDAIVQAAKTTCTPVTR